MRLEQPPIIVASTQRASMPSECATIVGRYGLSPLIATPSTSAGVRPQSASARRAASVARPSDDSGDGADLGGLRRADDRDRDVPRHAALGRNTRQRDVADGLEHDLDRKVERQHVGIGVDLDEVGQQPGALVELDHRDHVRRVEAGRGRWVIT